MTTSPVTVRAAVAEDLDGIHYIERQSFPDPWSHRMFHDIVGAALLGLAHVLVAEAEDRIVGFAVAERADPEVHLTNLAVDPLRRRLGIARHLVAAVLAWARSEGLEEVWLEVRESNVAARSLYRAEGFAVVSRRRDYYRLPTEDALVLVLPLRSTPPLHEVPIPVSLARCE